MVLPCLSFKMVLPKSVTTMVCVCVCVCARRNGEKNLLMKRDTIADKDTENGSVEFCEMICAVDRD